MDTGAALVFLADQPLVQLAVVEALVAAWKAGTGVMVRPRYKANPGIPGHPALLDRSIWPLAQQLHGDRGFAGLLDSILRPSVILDVAGDNPDVDTLADLQSLEEST
jgi:CTP:molybdopterin cytidylyltransferase MocA